MKLLLNNVRLSFPALWESEQYQGQGPRKFRASFLVPADSPLRKTIDAAVADVAKEKWGPKATNILKGIVGDAKACSWQDGERKEYDGYAGHWALTATRDEKKGRPVIVNTNKQPLTQADGKPYAGCYVNATVEIWAQDNQYGKGLRAELLAVQFARDGDAFTAGSKPSADDFEVIEDAGSTADLV